MTADSAISILTRVPFYVVDLSAAAKHRCMTSAADLLGIYWLLLEVCRYVPPNPLSVCS